MLVGGLEHVLFSIIYRIILPLIFFKMVKTTNQYDILGITCLVVSNSVGFQGAEPPRDDHHDLGPQTLGIPDREIPKANDLFMEVEMAGKIIELNR